MNLSLIAFEQAFATLATPSGLHLLDPSPALKHAATIADEACAVAGDTTTGVSPLALVVTSCSAVLTMPVRRPCGTPEERRWLQSTLPRVRHSSYVRWYRQNCLMKHVLNQRAIELHQINSPETAHHFLDDLLRGSTKLKNSLDDLGEFASYVGRSWVGIIKSRDIFL